MPARSRTLTHLQHAAFAWRMRLTPDETTLMVVMAVVVGVVGGFGAILFRWLVDVFQGLVLGHGERTVDLLAGIPWWHTLLLPVIGAIIVGPLVHFLAREARGHGVPEVIGAIVFRGGVIRPIVAAVKIVASAITIACGGSVGREGPIVQIGAAMASAVGQVFRFSPQRLRTMIGCGRPPSTPPSPGRSSPWRSCCATSRCSPSRPSSSPAWWPRPSAAISWATSRRSPCPDSR